MGGYGEIETAVLRDAFLKTGLRPCDVARRLGWTAKYGKKDHRIADGPRVSRTLGMLDEGPKRRRKRVTRDMALKLAEAMELDPVDLGL